MYLSNLRYHSSIVLFELFCLSIQSGKALLAQEQVILIFVTTRGWFLPPAGDHSSWKSRSNSTLFEHASWIFFSSHNLPKFTPIWFQQDIKKISRVFFTLYPNTIHYKTFEAKLRNKKIQKVEKSTKNRANFGSGVRGANNVPRGFTSSFHTFQILVYARQKKQKRLSFWFFHDTNKKQPLWQNSATAITYHWNQKPRVTSTWFEHATFWSGVRRATIAPRSLATHNCTTQIYGFSL